MPIGIYLHLHKAHTRPHTKDARRRISEAKKKNPTKFWLGKNHSEETKLKISKSRKGKGIGKNNGNWIADRTLLKQRQQRNDPAYKSWRRGVWERDGFKCKIDNKDCKGRIEAHHILGWTKHPELRYEINNGITLCHFHHPRKRSEEVELAPIFAELLRQ